MSFRKLKWLGLWLALSMVAGVVGVAAQGEPSISVTGSEPQRVLNTQPATLSVFGANFTDQTTVRLVGFGLLQTTFVNPTALSASIPAGLPAGDYQVEISDPARGTTFSPNTLRVDAPPPTPLPTIEPLPPPTPFPTPEPPTPVPGEPSLLLRNYRTTPEVLRPGDTVVIEAVLVNAGTRPAQNISVAISGEGSFAPAPGQGAVLLPGAVLPGATVPVTLRAVVQRAATEGANNLNLTFAYRDAFGGAFTGSAALTVNVQALVSVSRVTVGRYSVLPDPVQAGERVRVRVLLTNSGTSTASQVLFRINSGDGVLLAGPQGDTFPVGDLEPLESAELELPMIVGQNAQSGPQLQPATISFVQNGEAQTINTSLTIEVVRRETPSPVFVLESYSTGQERLRPGDRFDMTLVMKNVGTAPAQDLLVTFGTLSDDPPSGGTPTGGVTTVPSAVFAPLGGGGSRFVSTLGADETVTLNQAFIVSGTVSSGVYSLPVTVRYVNSEGTTTNDTLNASLVVVRPPRLRITPDNPLGAGLNTGTPTPITVEIRNVGRADVLFTDSFVTASNADVVEGVEGYIGTVRADETGRVETVVLPLEEGPVTVTVTLGYIDDLNQEQTIVLTYEGEAVFVPPAEPDFDGGFIFEPPPITEVPPEQRQRDLLGRLLLGLLGLGS